MRNRKRKQFEKYVKRAGVILLTGALLTGSLCLTGCFGFNRPGKPNETTTETQATKEPESDTKATEETEAETKKPEQGGDTSEKYYMPDVVGMKDREAYQSVQNYLKAKGLEIEIFQGWVQNSDPNKNLLTAYTEPGAGEELSKDTKAIYIYVNEGYNEPESSEAETEEKNEATPTPTAAPTATPAPEPTPVPSETPTPTPAVHVHELQFHEGIYPTCQKAGHEEYYQCSSCGKIYRDKNASKEVANLDQLTIAKIDHDIKHEPFRYPTCEHEGCKGYYYCDMCGTWWADFGNGVGPVLEDHKEAFTEKGEHSLRRLEPEEATCEHAYIGTLCFRCDDCGKFFLDSSGNTPAKESDVYEKPSPHTLTHIPEAAADLDHHGTLEHWHCAFCNQNFLDAEGKNAVTDPDQLVKHFYNITVVAGTVQEYCPVCGKVKPKN